MSLVLNYVWHVWCVYMMCMWEHTCMHLDVWEQQCTLIPLSTYGHRRTIFCVRPSFHYALRQGLAVHHWTCEETGSQASRESPVSASCLTVGALGWQMCAILYMDSGDSNSGSHACMPSALTNESFPRSVLLLSNKESQLSK